MNPKIFFSWQSDSPSSTNKNFLEDALRKAASRLPTDPELIEALRDEQFEIDKDTKGVPGTPPIVETIFNKISQCSIFIPDLTFIGVTKTGRKTPNPNVLIEYGWALHSIGHSRIIPVMNSAYFDPNPESMPFDMRHLRMPLIYRLPDDATQEERQSAKSSLIKGLTGAMRDIFNSTPQSSPSQPEFIETPHIGRRSIFIPSNEKLLTHVDQFGDSEHKDIYPEGGPHQYLRLIPTRPINPMTAIKIEQAWDPVKLRPMGPLATMDAGINKYGFVIFKTDGSANNKTSAFIQIFENGEIWTVDTLFLADINQRKVRLIPARYELDFVNALESCRRFAISSLGLNAPFKWIAGMTGIEGRAMRLPSPPGYVRINDESRPCVRDEICHSGIIDLSDNPAQALSPFFAKIFESCGVDRQAFIAQ